MGKGQSRKGAEEGVRAKGERGAVEEGGASVGKQGWLGYEGEEGGDGGGGGGGGREGEGGGGAAGGGGEGRGFGQGVAAAFFARLGGGGHHGYAPGPRPLGRPQPPGPRPPLSLAPESSMWILQFFHAPHASQDFGVGEVGVGGAARGSKGQTPTSRDGGISEEWHWQLEMPVGKKGQLAPPFGKGVKMLNGPIERLQRQEAGGTAFPVLLACQEARGYALRCEDMGVVADVVGDHRGWGIRPVGGQPGGICRIGARHCLPAQAQEPKPARSRRPPSVVPPNPRDALTKAHGGNPPHPPRTRHGMLSAFWR